MATTRRSGAATAVLMCLALGACQDGPGSTAATDAGTATDGGGASPAASCEAVRAAYGRLEAQCGRPANSLYLSQEGNPPDCAAVTGVTRPEDVAVCVSWLDWPADACGELHADWRATANCLDLFTP